MTGSGGDRLCYVHDPMCSWCWAFRPVLGRLIAALPPGLPFERVLGGLAPDSDRPMDPALREALEATWRRIAEVVPGTRFDHSFWREGTPRRSTFRACRAVIAAREQDPAFEAPMIEAIQRAYYLDARNPSDRDVLIDLARRLGADEARFAAALDDTRVRALHDVERGVAAALGVHGYPSLVLVADAGTGGARALPVAVDYHDAGTMLERIAALRQTR